MNKMKVSYAPSVRRLPSYLLIARQAQDNGDEYLSGTVIASELDLEPIQVRKDLSITGIAGKPKRGYPVQPLVKAIESYLNWDRQVNAVVVGAGNLGSALMGFPGFREHGLRIIGGFDMDSSIAGSKIYGIPVYPMDQVKSKIEELASLTAILTVPSVSAQSVTDILVECGIKALWNFTNVKLKVPDDVVVQNEDLSSGYAMLSIKCRMRRDRLI
ncbi:MAG: redox-sensing transcriptional repressor Rex [Spirochaetales bacterium]|nr:MAG: redox-sensing transcriptional repressor Rex [Spirochaetales bacterium]